MSFCEASSVESNTSVTCDKENEDIFTSKRKAKQQLVGTRAINREQSAQLEANFQTLNEELKEFGEKHFEREEVKDVCGQLRDKLRKCNELGEVAYASVNRKGISLDATFFANASAVNCKLVKATAAEFKSFDVCTFAERLLLYLQSNSQEDADGSQYSGNGSTFLNHNGLSCHYSHLLGDVPRFHFIYGSFECDTLVKSVKEKKERRAFKDVAAKKAQSDDATRSKEDDLTAKAVDLLFQTVKTSYRRSEKKPLPFFSLISDKESFSKTVENAFHSSFLVKESYVNINSDESTGNVPLIEPMKKDQRNESDSSVLKGNVQSVLSFSMNEWRKWIEEND